MSDYIKLCALLKTASVLRSERHRSKDGKLSNSIDCDLDRLSDTIFEIFTKVCKQNNISDYDMTLVNYLKAIGCADSIENLNLLGWEKP